MQSQATLSPKSTGHKITAIWETNLNVLSDVKCLWNVILVGSLSLEPQDMTFRIVLPCHPPHPMQPSKDRALTGPVQEASGKAGSSKSHLDETQALSIWPTSVYRRPRHESANTSHDSHPAQKNADRPSPGHVAPSFGLCPHKPGRGGDGWDNSSATL